MSKSTRGWLETKWSGDARWLYVMIDFQVRYVPVGAAGNFEGGFSKADLLSVIAPLETAGQGRKASSRQSFGNGNRRGTSC